MKPKLTQKTSQPLLSRLLSIHATIFALFFSIVWFSTSGQGIGTTPDSALFLSTASNLRNNLNLGDYTGKASSLAPPMYPALIAGVSVLTIRDTRFGAPRLLAGLTFGLLGVFTFLSLWLLTKSEVFSAIGCVAVASSHSLVKLGSLAGSDITFLTCSILGGIFFLVAISTRKNAWLWASAALFSLGCLTRYVGVIWPSIAICFLLFGGLVGSPRLRFMRAFKFGLIAFSPVFVWMVAWGLAEKTVGGRLFNWHPVDWEKIQQGIIVAGKAVGTHGSNVGWILFGASIFLLLVKRLLRKTEHGLTSPDSHSASTLAYLLLVSFALGYIGLLVFSISLFDVASPLDGRMLAPVSWIIITLFVLILHEAFRNTHLLKSVVASLLLVFFGWRFLFEVVPSISIWSTQGQGLSDRKVQYDPALAWIRNLDTQGLKIFSNTPWTIHLTTRKNVQFLPWKKGYTSGLPNFAYEEDLKEAVEMTANGGSIIVMDVEYLDPFAFPPSFEELTSAGLVPRNDLSSDRFRIYFPAPDS